MSTYIHPFQLDKTELLDFTNKKFTLHKSKEAYLLLCFKEEVTYDTFAEYR